MVFLFIFIMFILLFAFSKIRLEIVNFRFSSQYNRHINEDYKFVINFLGLGKIPILKISITKEKLEKINLKERIKDIDFDVIKKKNKISKNSLEAIKKSNIDIKRINLNIELGTENASLTSIIIPVISTFLSIILRNKIDKFENQIFIVKPVYINQNLINILLSGIFEIKMIHIINIIYILNKKERVNKYERTSNRRSYDYSYE